MTTIEPVWTRVHTRPVGWWGMLLLVATEATLFATLVASYFYLRFNNVTWPPVGIEKPRVLLPCIVTAVLVAASAPMAAAGRAVAAGRIGVARVCVTAALVLGAAFSAGQFLLLRDDWGAFRPAGSAYASIYYTLEGLLLAHVGAGLLLLGFVLLQLSRGSYRAERRAGFGVSSLYVYFVSVTAVVVLLTAYLSPQL
jgi:heme/copper-type cytochrome/quinol oxidase subunit 3